MKLISAILGSTALAICACHPVSIDRKAADVLKYTVMVDAEDSSGSGVVIGNSVFQTGMGEKAVHRSLILTCSHVVTDDFQQDAARTVDIMKDGKKYKGYLRAWSNQADLAVYEVIENWEAAPFFKGELKNGMPELVAGHPLAAGLQLSQGFVGEDDGGKLRSSEKNAADGKGMHSRQGSASIWPGNSGGPVFVETDVHGWQLGGIAEMVMYQPGGGNPLMGVRPALADTMGFFIPIETVRLFLNGVRM